MGDVGNCQICDQVFGQDFVLLCRHCGLELESISDLQAHWKEDSEGLICSSEDFPGPKKPWIKGDQVTLNLNLDQDSELFSAIDKNFRDNEPDPSKVKEEVNEAWFKAICEDPDAFIDDGEDSLEEEYEEDDYKPARRKKRRRETYLEYDNNFDDEYAAEKKKKKKKSRKRPDCYKCWTCGLEFSTMADLRIHKNQLEKCNTCGEKVAHLSIREHKKNEHKEELPPLEITCAECGKVFHSPKNYKWHYRRVHSKDFKYHYCNLCDYKSPDTFKVRLHHRLIHEENPKKDFTCLICGHETILKGAMKVHIISRHGEEAWETWKAYDWSKHDWDTHKFTESPPTTRSKGGAKSGGGSRKKTEKKKSKERSMCDICGKTFVSEANCVWHTKRVHLKELRMFQCETCDYKSPDKYKIKLHTRLIHQPDAKKEFICHVCAKEFALKGNLKAHVIAVHGKEMWGSWRKDLSDSAKDQDLKQESDSKAHSQGHQEHIAQPMNLPGLPHLVHSQVQPVLLPFATQGLQQLP